MMKFLIFGFLLFWLVSCSEKEEINSDTYRESPLTKHKFIKAVHFFSDTTPFTFWQEFEPGNINNDLLQIKNDGFNTVVLVIPWSGFETGFDKDQTNSDPRMYQRLHYILTTINKNGLDYILRLGYPHDFTPNTGGNRVSVCSGIYESEKFRNNWLDYLRKVKNVTENFEENLVSVLISWEDFWCPHTVFPFQSEERRIEISKNMGYGDWLELTESTVFKKRQNTSNSINIPIPKKQEKDYIYYLTFIDKKFNDLILNSAKKIFPKAAMEIRVDKDPVLVDGKQVWFSHDLYLNEKNYRGTYWAPFWGAENNGEKLTLDQVLLTFEYYLKQITDQGKNTNHIIEQFNFFDNSPGFSNNASIDDSAIHSFLMAAVPLLKKYAKGYGVWAYRNYVDNILYNSSFELGINGWESSDSLVIGDENDQQIKILKNGFIGQTYHPANRFKPEVNYQQLDLCLDTLEAGDLSVYANNVLVTNLTLKTGSACYKLDANYFTTETVEFKLKAMSNLIIDEIKLYGFVQRLDLYDEFNVPQKLLKSIREMNARLDSL